METSNARHRWLAIDLVRGLSAFAILIFHYQAFYFLQPGGPAIFASRSAQPFYSLLRPFFEYGHYAVHLFWMISGFVLASSYAGRQCTAREFIVARFARLYPLHFATLLLVALLQFLSHRWVGQYQVYPFNDPYHFFLNVFMAEFWGFQQGPSFNAVIWSVSIEVAIYAVFFAALPLLRRHGIASALVLALVFYLLLKKSPNNLFWACGYYFHVGALAFFVVRRLRGAGLALAVALALLGAWARFGSGVVDYIEPWTAPCLFAAIVVGAAAVDRFALATSLLRRTAWLGESTYSTYLLHMPLVMAATLLFTVYGVDRVALLGHGWFLVGFVAVVFALARICYLHFELPAQKLLRQRLLSRGEAAPLPATVAP